MKNKDLGIDIFIGKKSKNTSNYRLLVAGQNLGELAFTRGRKFSEKDSMQLEYLITSLLSPLRNALMYQQALNTARKDPLTGVNNRTGFEDCLLREINLANLAPRCHITFEFSHRRQAGTRLALQAK